MYALEGGSVGLQIGVEATDFVFAVMNDRGAGSLLRTKAKLGASVAAAPKGRSATADTDAHMRAEIGAKVISTTYALVHLTKAQPGRGPK